MNSTNLITNALLATTWEHSRKDYIDIITPFIVYAAFHESDPQNRYVDINKVKLFIQSEFSLNIIDSIIICAFNRKTDLFSSKKVAGSKQFFISDTAKYDLQQFEEKRITNQKNYDYFIRKMDEYFQEKFKKNWEKSKLEEKLNQYIGHNFLGLLNPDNKKITYRDVELADYLNHIIHYDKNLFLILQNIVKGQMIFVSIYAQNVLDADRKQKMKDLSIYFDTTFIFNLLGYGGKYNQEYAKQIVDLLEELGAKLFCFEHNYQEVRGILESCERGLSLGREDKLRNLDYFLENDFTASDLIVLISKLRENISKHLTIVEPPDYSIPTTNIDWLGFAQHLNNQINYSKSKSLEHDVESIAAIFRLRKGHLSRTLEGCKALFVTTNLTLVRSVRDYHKNKNDTEGYYPCLSDYEIANIAWLKSPNNMQNEIIDKSIRFATELLQEPSPVFWEKFVATVDKYKDSGSISDSDAYELKFELYSRKHAGDFFDDDESKIDVVSLKELLRRIREQYAKNTMDELDKSKKLLNQLRAEDDNNAIRKSKRRARFVAMGWITCYVFAFAIVIGAATISIYNLIEKNTWPIFVLIVDVLSVIITAFVPQIKGIWRIKTVIKKKYDQAFEKTKSYYDHILDEKYSGKEWS